LWDVGNSIFQSLFKVAGVDVVEFSPNGQYLAVGRQSESVVLWSLEDGKISHQFPHPPGKLSSLHFSPTGDCLMAGLRKCNLQCLWRPDTQQMVSFDLDVPGNHPPVVHSSHTNHVFVPRGHTVEIWEASTTGLNMIFKIESLGTTSICLSRDGHRLLIGSYDGTVKMWNLEDLGGNQPVTEDNTDRRRIIGLSPSGNMVATVALKSTCVELRDTATWELIGCRDIEGASQAVFFPDDNRIAVLSESLVTICDINHPENHLSFNPSPKGKSVWVREAAFQTRDDLVICTQLKDGMFLKSSGLLQVWKLKDHSECIFSLDIYINHSRDDPAILLAPDGLTLIATHPTLCYSWNHDTAQFQPFHFADETHLVGPRMAYSSDGKLVATCSRKEKKVRVWDTRTGQLCCKPITMSDVDMIALSPALNDRFLGDRLIALRCRSIKTVSLLDVNAGHLYVRFCDPGLSRLVFIRDGTKLVSYDPTRIYDIANLTAKHRNATNWYELVPQDMEDGWMVGEENELLFWVPSEHRRVLCLPHAETVLWQSTKVDLSHFKFGSKWTKCIDQRWLEKMEEMEQRLRKLLG